MALDYMAIASLGVYPTPTPTMTQRVVFAVSFGLISFSLSTGTVSVIKRIKSWLLYKFRGR